MTCFGLGAALDAVIHRTRVPPAELCAAAAARGQPINCLNCEDFDGPFGDPGDDHSDDPDWDEPPNGYCLSDRGCVADRAAGYAGHWTDESWICSYWRPTSDIRQSRRPALQPGQSASPLEDRDRDS